MIKKIRVAQIKPGMFIHDFNCGWLRHPFCRNSLKVKNEKIIRRIIKSGIHEVNIDTDRGLDVSDAPIVDETLKGIQTGLRKVIGPGIENMDPVSVQEGLIKSKEIKKEAKRSVQKITEDNRPGKQLGIQSGTVSAQGGPFRTKEIKQTAQDIMEDIRPDKQPGMQNGPVSVHVESVKEKETIKEAKNTMQNIMEDIGPGRKPEIKSGPVTVQEELVKAKEVKKEARKIVQDIMEDIKLGRQLEIKKVDNVVGKMVNSILRNKDALTGLGRIKKVDEYTFMHSVNVGVLMVTFGKHLGFDYDLLKAIGIGGLLHDMGKIKVPGEILLKKGRLSEDEMITVKKHVEHSHVILKETTGINEISVYVAAHHHERLDGTGYPNRLKAEDISIFGQMSAIVDVYDALTSDRCYQKGILPTLALKKLYEWNMYFNKELLQQFVRCMGIYPVGSLVRLQSGLLGVVLSHNEDNLMYPIVRIIYDTRKSVFTMPCDIDLLEDYKKGGRDRVVSCELPDKWKIRPETYL